MTQKIGDIAHSKLVGMNVNGNAIGISANDTVNVNNAVNTIVPIYNRRWSMLAFSLSIIAVVISCGVGITLYLATQDKGTISNDAFVGAIGGLMGICATVIVGFQIYNSIDINQKIKEQSSLYNQKINELETKQTYLDNLISQSKRELESTKEDSKKELLSLQSHVRIVQAIAVSEKQPFAAFYSWYYAMKYAVDANDSKTIHLIMENLENLYRDIRAFDQQELYDYIHDENQDNIENIKMLNIQKMSMPDEYKEIQDKFEYFVSDIIQLVKKNHNTLA